MATLAGTPSDEDPGIAAAGKPDIGTIYMSVSARHPEGRDAEYIEWHGLDHEPDQYLVPGLRAAFRLVSTPECRSARAATDERFDGVDHVMTYLFTGVDQLDRFNDLNAAMTRAGRNPYVEGRPMDAPMPGMPLIERGAFDLQGMVAAPRIKVSAGVLPWWPARGIYLLIERGSAPAGDLAAQPGVGGVWWGAGLPLEFPYANADHAGIQVTYCFLDGEPAEVAQALRPALEARWSAGPEPLLAAPFHRVVRFEWGRYLPG